MLLRLLCLVLAGTLLALSAPPALAKSCPPGLAKKNPPCVPPGQARKGTVVWAPGDWIGDTPVHWITYPDRYDLPPLAPGQRYVVLGNQLYVADQDTLTVLAILQTIEAILD